MIYEAASRRPSHGHIPWRLKEASTRHRMQAEEFIEHHRTISLCPLTTFSSDARLFRPVLLPSPENGLEHRSEAMIDKTSPVRKDGIGKRFGVALSEELLRLELALITIAGLDRYLVFTEPKAGAL